MVPDKTGLLPSRTPSPAPVPRTTSGSSQRRGRRPLRGLLFSKFDTIDLILANDFPDIPEDQRRTVARALLTPCEPIFASYALGDDFASRPEFRQLKAELRLGIRQWIDDNGPPGYEAKLRHRVRTRKMRDGEPKKTNRNK